MQKYTPALASTLYDGVKYPGKSDLFLFSQEGEFYLYLHSSSLRIDKSGEKNKQI